MPQIIVAADRGAAFGEGAVTFRERVNVADFESGHFAMQLVERLGWAVEDADALEHIHPEPEHLRPGPENIRSDARELATDPDELATDPKELSTDPDELATDPPEMTDDLDDEPEWAPRERRRAPTPA